MHFGLIALVLFLSACSPIAMAIHPISESHSQLTASEYDDAEAAFSGGLASMPSELVAAADAECQRLLEKRDLASAFALGLTGLGGAGGLATLLPKDADPAEQRNWNLGLGISTLAVGTTAVILGALVRSWSARFEERCGTKAAPDPPTVEHPASDEVDPDAGT